MDLDNDRSKYTSINLIEEYFIKSYELKQEFTDALNKNEME